MSNEQIVKSIKLLTSKGIHVSAYNIIGMPGMDRKHVFETIKLNKEAGPSSSIVSVFIPYLDNDMTKKLVQDGLLNPAKIRVSNGLYPTVEIDAMSSKEISGLYNTFNIYMKFPKWAYSLVKILENGNFMTTAIRKIIYTMMRYADKKPNIKPKQRIKLDQYFHIEGANG